METSCIDSTVKALKGVAFFDWLAGRVEHVLAKGGGYGHSAAPLPMGLAWSFPIAQSSIRSGTLLGMGKGFACSSGVLGQDLGEVITKACQRRNLRIRIEAIVNDSPATLLSSAYLDDSTRLALIFGTGMNAAIHLAVKALGPSKLVSRPKRWHDRADHVLVNTELSMFGKGILPTTRWDDELNSCHFIPDYQPFEYLITGRHLGEIVRLILVEMAATTGLLGGDLPASFLRPYSLDTHTIAIIEADDTPTLAEARTFLQDHHSFPTSPTLQDLQYIQTICRCVSRRATGYLATGIHALWKLQTDSEGLDPHASGHVSIGCNGSVINKYPGFLQRCQEYVDDLTEAEGLGRGRVALEPAHDAAILGAAVAVALAEKEESG
ncbi:MAG: hypothetical protein M1830_005554 [Pleopsidium flavum]|nr:MAG: hypothetical protein M1830_005554 [Pleopsidium flavum]